MEFLQQNHQHDNWYIQIETFDPHEPFDTPNEYISRICGPDTLGELVTYNVNHQLLTD